ncbi:MAG: hypothetical protein KBE65_16895 [Phycisphaerae bacterium]|nr:hypothetical protein [Phycisphaerae bacterium]
MVTPSRSQTYGATVFFFLLVIVSTATAKYSGGRGEPNDPYQIATAADLIALGENPNDYDKHFILSADIDLDPNLPGGKVFDRAVIAPDTDPANYWSVFDGSSFTGVFDGAGHTVSHLTITGGSYLGLFGQVGQWDAPAGEIRNLGVADVNIFSSGSYVGGLVGSNGRLYSDGGTMTHCYSTGSVSGDKSVGGLVGSNRGEVANCYSTGTVRGGSSIGGLLGENGGDVINCYSKSTVVGDYDSVGGLVGTNGGPYLALFHVLPCGSIIQCYSTGAVTGTEDVGGLVGANPGNVLNCYSTSAVSADSAVGGLVGVNWVMPYHDTNATIDGRIANCYSTGVVIGNSDVGGLVGVGALFYSNEDHVIRSFWDTQTSGQTTSDGGTGLPTAEMQTASTFLDAGWDLVGETENGPNDVWKIVEGQVYPLLSWQKYGGGTGEPNDPYLIYTAEHLNAFGAEPNDYYKHFKLMADIDLSGHMYDRAVIPGFGGVFDGNDHIISNLTIEGGSGLGLFGRLKGYGGAGEVTNLRLDAVKVSGMSYVGGLVGYNSHGSIVTSHSSGSVTGDFFVGGLVGHNEGTLAQCNSTGVVDGNDDVGGLVGWNSGSIGTSHSSGSVIGNDSVGGLAGTSSGEVTDCFSTSTVSGGDRVGGLIGRGYMFARYGLHRGIVDRCYSTGTVEGSWGVGGLVGGNGGEVTCCYSTSTVNGDGDVGGLVGMNWGSYTFGVPHFFTGLIAQCYSTGSVSGNDDVGGLVGSNTDVYYGDEGAVSYSFWDIETSGQAASAAGTGKTTAEMQTAATFLDAGWDFVGETANGTEDIWWINEGKDYPRLWWELIPEN